MTTANTEISSQTPENLNLVLQDKFKFSLRKLPNVSFFCATAEIPGISLKGMEVPNPLNRIVIAGKKLNYETFSITFRVDEDLKNYIELFNWIKGIAAPENFSQFKDLTASNNLTSRPQYSIYSDGTLFTLTSVQNYNVHVTFRDMFPTDLTPLSFNFDENTHLNATAKFSYLNYVFE